MIPLNGQINPKILASDLNMFASLRFWREAPMVADDWQRAAINTTLRWDYLYLYQMTRTNFGRNGVRDPFGIGFEGSPEDTVINASVHVQEIKSFDALPGDQHFWQQFELVCERWDSWMDSLIQQRVDGNPLPEPPPPPPPKPEPVPVPIPPTEEKPPETAPVPSGSSWRKTCAMIAGVLGGGLFIAKLFLPGSIVLILEAVQKILSALGG